MIHPDGSAYERKCNTPKHRVYEPTSKRRRCAAQSEMLLEHAQRLIGIRVCKQQARVYPKSILYGAERIYNNASSETPVFSCGIRHSGHA